MPINITQESYDKVKQVGQGPNSIRKYKKPRLDGPLLNKDPHLLGLDEPVVVSNPDPPPPDKQPRILFSGINPRKHVKVMHTMKFSKISYLYILNSMYKTRKTNLIHIIIRICIIRLTENSGIRWCTGSKLARCNSSRHDSTKKNCKIVMLLITL